MNEIRKVQNTKYVQIYYGLYLYQIIYESVNYLIKSAVFVYMIIDIINSEFQGKEMM